jgi:N-methylhydantoinase B
MIVTAMHPATRTVDPFTFEILSHRLHQITKEIGITLERVGGTVLTTQRHDYINALYRANGDILSAGEGTGWHVACASFAVKRIIERFQDDEGIDPGDMFLLNDPYTAAIHQSDVYIMSPVHYDDRLVAWSATFVHVMDIGAMSPGGFSPGATEVFHEGIRIAGIKLIERGKLRRDVFDAFTNMTRNPAMVALDLKCEIAANNVARNRVMEVCDQYGADLVEDVGADMIRYSEQVLRRRLRDIPDGTWEASAVIQASGTWTVCVKLTKSGDHLVFDFTGSDPQATVGVNLPYHATFGACYGALITLLGWDVPRNHGGFAPVEVIAPPGTVVNARPPAPVSMNTTGGGPAVKFVADAVLTQMVATSATWRGEVIAKGTGHLRAQHAGISQRGWYYVGMFGGLDGSGATGHADGIDCGGGGYMTDHNVEWFESQYPFLHLFRRQITDGGGSGEFRGGVGQESALTIHDAPEGRIKGIPFGVEGPRNSGQGLFGGYPAPPSVLELRKGSQVHELMQQGQAVDDLESCGGEAITLPYREFELTVGDVLFNSNSGGGGYGDPLDRDIALVAADVAQGLVSTAAAEEVYGVLLASASANGDSPQVDADGTRELRERLRASRRPAPDGRDGSDAARSVGGDHADDSAGDHPLRQNLEIASHLGRPWVRCAVCKHPLCPEGEDWAEACDRNLLSPLRAGRLLQPLESRFRLEQLSCPSCAALFNTDVVEVGA